MPSNRAQGVEGYQAELRRVGHYYERQPDVRTNQCQCPDFWAGFTTSKPASYVQHTKHVLVVLPRGSERFSVMSMQRPAYPVPAHYTTCL